ncbi:MAG: hypothetical protein ACREKM_02685, partial [Longimicrobiales bacterium]
MQRVLPATLALLSVLLAAACAGAPQTKGPGEPGQPGMTPPTTLPTTEPSRRPPVDPADLVAVD